MRVHVFGIDPGNPLMARVDGSAFQACPKMTHNRLSLDSGFGFLRDDLKDFTKNKKAALLRGDEAKALASQFAKGNTLRVRVRASSGNKADWEIPLKGFAKAFRAAIPPNCGRARASR